MPTSKLDILAPGAAGDDELLRQVARGDRAAQRTVLARLARRVHLVSVALLRDERDAEDATRSALRGILERAATFEGQMSLEVWATRIAVATAAARAEARQTSSRRSREKRERGARADRSGP